jgi:hypothetical protein
MTGGVIFSENVWMGDLNILYHPHTYLTVFNLKTLIEELFK